jgi:hypothetical protein
MRTVPRLKLALSALSIVSTACASSTILRTTGASTGSIGDGLRYYLPRDVVTVDARATYRSEGAWKYENGKCDVTTRPKDPVWIETAWDINSATVPDRSRSYRLGIGESGSVAQSMKLAVTNDGLLTAVSYNAQDQRAEIAQNILKGIASIAGTAFGAGQLPLTSSSAVKAAANIRAEVKGFDGGGALPRTPDEGCYLAKAPTAAQEQLDARLRLEAALQSARSARETLLKAASNATTLLHVSLINAQDSLAQRRIDFAESQLGVVRAAITAGIATEKKRQKITPVDTVIRMARTFDLSQLPDKLPGGTWAALLAATPAGGWHDLLQTARLAIVVTDLPPGPAYNGPVDQTGVLACRDTDKTCATIRYRPAITRMVDVYAAADPSTAAAMELKQSKPTALASSKDPEFSVSFEASNFGQTGLGLVFARPGTISTLEQMSSAGLAAATGTIAAAITAARSEFVKGVQDVATAQTAAEGIQQASRNARIAELKDQKTLLDAQMALDGTNATKEQMAQKRQLDAELALLQAQQALAAAQENAATSAELASMRIDVARLQAQIDLLKKELELAKAKKELSDTAAGSATP